MSGHPKIIKNNHLNIISDHFKIINKHGKTTINVYQTSLIEIE